MSYYEDFWAFQERIFSFEKSDFSFGVDYLSPSNSVMEKVNDDGTFRYFIGDTVVFDLDNSQKEFIQNHYLSPLYHIAGRTFAKEFHKKTLHMTLHDLNASNCSNEETLRRMFETEITLAEKLASANFKAETITMETTCVFNMVNTSLVLGLKPKSQCDYDKLMNLYMFVDDIQPLPYQLTPHITLAYYGKQGIEKSTLDSIERTINYLNKNHLDIVLSTTHLYYQKFVNMDNFFSIMPFVR